MIKDAKIMILSANYGAGHAQVSHALQEQFSQQGIGDVEVIDLFKLAHPAITKVTEYFYIKSFSVAPELYGWCYYRTQKMNHNNFLSSWLHSFGLGKLKQIISEKKPDVVINTFPMLVMPIFREKTGVMIPTFTVVTDFVLHNRWLHNEIDKYYVATEELKTNMVLDGFPAERIVVSGIPLRAKFRQSLETVTIREKYQLDPAKKTVLVLAGAFGVVKHLKEICLSLMSQPTIQILLVCGNNKKLKAEMDDGFAENPNVQVLGYADNLHELMHAADCIVTKPGGVTLAEALHSDLPSFLVNPVPGQELENARYLAAKGAAFITREPYDTAKQILDLLNNNMRLHSAKQAIKALHRQGAAETIVQDILLEMQRFAGEGVLYRSVRNEGKKGNYEFST